MTTRRNDIRKLTDTELCELYASSGRKDCFRELCGRMLGLVYGLCLKYAPEEKDASAGVTRIYDALSACDPVSLGSVAAVEKALRAIIEKIWSGEDAPQYENSQKRIPWRQLSVEHRNALFLVLEHADGELPDAFAAILPKLLKPQRECLHLFFVKRRSFAEIADATGYLLDDVRGYLEGGLADFASLPYENAPEEARVAKLSFPMKGDRLGSHAWSVELESLRNDLWADALAGYERYPGRSAEGLSELEKELAVRWGRTASEGYIRSRRYGLVAVLSVCLVGVALLLGRQGMFDTDEQTSGPPQPVEAEPSEPIGERADSVQPSEDQRPVSRDPVAVPEESRQPSDTMQQTTGSSETVVRKIRSFSVFVPDDQGLRLEETALQGVKSSRKDTVAKREHLPTVPRIGMRKFREYLEKAAVLPDTLVGGEVILTFRVNRFGRPSEIRTEQGPTRELNREAVRLIESGPEWKECQERIAVSIYFQ